MILAAILAAAGAAGVTTVWSAGLATVLAARVAVGMAAGLAARLAVGIGVGFSLACRGFGGPDRDALRGLP